ncbi:recombinase family protein [Bacillaceae bacterium SIJ1]|uniref:recombinase family protein n=1 Tax=Litoribacterium kuwaitense TaxID=1398745 RepID=UPI0013ED8578|nr:recombinase family protein [Litoribacterium kuwaitense]NGP43467.1 recombinase family protein [Litoribacterium kuwaitense]
MERIAMYLRKSREDVEMEREGEDTLSIHRTRLFKLAKERSLNIVKVYEEVVSGDTIIHRPQMIQLLKDVEDRQYDGVLCIDMQRLGRGNMKDQGIILETFKESNTKIITVNKTYDLNDEFDEDYSEFETFMGRREYKMITRRMQSGRTASIDQGNYLGTYAPYGYDIWNRGRKDRTLKPHPTEAEVLKRIFKWYTHPDPEMRIGAAEICNRLNAEGIPSKRGVMWEPSMVRGILSNPIYTGKVTWQKKKYKRLPDGRNVVKKQKDYMTAEGKHEALIDEETFALVRKYASQWSHVVQKHRKGLTNPLAGIVKCGHCGRSMTRRPHKTQPTQLLCLHQKHCGSKSSQLHLVEGRMLQGLRAWMKDYSVEVGEVKPTDDTEVVKQSLAAAEKELEELRKQQDNLYTFLERGIYDEDTFLERQAKVADRISRTERRITDSKQEIRDLHRRNEAKNNIIPQIQNVLDAYHMTDNVYEKNNLLKAVLNKAVYKKEKGWSKERFDLDLFPKIGSLDDV